MSEALATTDLQTSDQSWSLSGFFNKIVAGISKLLPQPSKAFNFAADKPYDANKPSVAINANKPQDSAVAVATPVRMGIIQVNNLSSDSAIEGLLPSKNFNPEALEMQKKLAALGYDLEQNKQLKNNGVDGFYGRITKDAVADFQRKNGLKPDGIANAETFAAIEQKFLASGKQYAQGMETKAQGFVASLKRNFQDAADFTQKVVAQASHGLSHLGLDKLPDGAYLTRLAQVESSSNPLATNSRSSAKGLYQFIDKTGAQYGLDKSKFGTSEYTRDEIAAVRDFTADNKKVLVQGLGREPRSGELYLAHQQGAGGALKLLKNPDELAVNTVGSDAVRLNGGHSGMTNQEFANKWINKFESGMQQTPATQVAVNMTAPAAAMIPS